MAAGCGYTGVRPRLEGFAISTDPQYPDHFIARLHRIWGEGFLSPGGPEEVSEIVRDIDLAGKVVLDVGFGTGGPAIALVRNHAAASVVGIDVEPQLRERAATNIDAAGVADRIELRLVEPGPFPFDDETFDVVFSKDSMVHIGDKPALFREVMRVLKPGGAFVASDWLAGDGESGQAELARFCEVGHLEFAMATAAEMEAALAAAGFRDVASRDRNAWYAAVCADELAQVEGPLQQELRDLVGDEIYAHWREVRRALAAAVSAGGLRPTHLRGRKPAT